MPTVISFVGLPGCGKGTQANILSRELNLKTYSVGELLRSKAEQNTDEGLGLRALLEKGIIVPAEIVNKVVGDLLGKEAAPIILDGYPRTLEQAEFLLGYPKLKMLCVYFKLDPELLYSRIESRVQCSGCNASYSLQAEESESKCPFCGESGYYRRADDSRETLKTRIEQFNTSTLPLVELYRDKGLLCIVDAGQEISRVTEQLTKAIAGFIV